MESGPAQGGSVQANWPDYRFRELSTVRHVGVSITLPTWRNVDHKKTLSPDAAKRTSNRVEYGRRDRGLSERLFVRFDSCRRKSSSPKFSRALVSIAAKAPAFASATCTRKDLRDDLIGVAFPYFGLAAVEPLHSHTLPAALDRISAVAMHVFGVGLTIAAPGRYAF